MRTLLVIALLAQGCATAFNGRYERVPVTSEPAGAAVAVDCGSGARAEGVTPTTVLLRRGADACSITLSRDGYADQRVGFTRVVNRKIWWNLLPGTGVGLAAGISATTVSFLDDSGGSDDAGNGAFAGGALAGTGGAMLVDRWTGAMFTQVPSSVSVKLQPR